MAIVATRESNSALESDRNHHNHHNHHNHRRGEARQATGTNLAPISTASVHDSVHASASASVHAPTAINARMSTTMPASMRTGSILINTMSSSNSRRRPRSALTPSLSSSLSECTPTSTATSTCAFTDLTATPTASTTASTTTSTTTTTNGISISSLTGATIHDALARNGRPPASDMGSSYSYITMHKRPRMMSFPFTSATSITSSDSSSVSSTSDDDDDDEALHRMRSPSLVRPRRRVHFQLRSTHDDACSFDSDSDDDSDGTAAQRAVRNNNNNNKCFNPTHEEVQELKPMLWWSKSDRSAMLQDARQMAHTYKATSPNINKQLVRKQLEHVVRFCQTQPLLTDDRPYINNSYYPHNHNNDSDSDSDSDMEDESCYAPTSSHTAAPTMLAMPGLARGLEPIICSHIPQMRRKHVDTVLRIQEGRRRPNTASLMARASLKSSQAGRHLARYLALGDQSLVHGVVTKLPRCGSPPSDAQRHTP